MKKVEKSISCFIYNTSIPLSGGDHVLYYKPGVTWRCGFGSDPKTGCKTCLENGIWTMDIGAVLTLTFNGRGCGEITGTLLSGPRIYINDSTGPEIKLTL